MYRHGYTPEGIIKGHSSAILGIDFSLNGIINCIYIYI